MLPHDFNEDVDLLRKDGYEVEVKEADGYACAIIRNFPLPPGYSKPSTNLLIRAPMSYRNGRPDMFWTEVDVLRANGQPPQNADQIETYLDQRWRRFSWHPQNWNPGADNLRTYVHFIITGLQKAQ